MSCTGPLPSLCMRWNGQSPENNPVVAHLFNIILFGLLCVLVFLVSAVLFQNDYFPAFFTALFFAIHPIHTEVVANIKSVDEILGLLFFMACLVFLYNYLQHQKARHLAISVLLYGLCLFSKESSVAFVVLIPLFIYYTLRPKTGNLLKTSLYFLLPLAIFLLIAVEFLHLNLIRALCHDFGGFGPVKLNAVFVHGYKSIGYTQF